VDSLLKGETEISTPDRINL